MEQEQYRQGDVFLMAIDRVPAAAKEIPREAGRVILAHGEVTGHAHGIRDSRVMFRMDEAGSYLTVLGEAPVALTHEEHAPIEVPPGDYRVVRQREYSPSEIRNVAD